jgi:CDP-4-dehydro-6-deoxyglucose reductase, E3
MSSMSFEVRLMPSGRRFTVERGERILSAGFAVGAKMPSGCRMGTCRTCKGRLIEGEVDHGNSHPGYLTPTMRAQGYALLCQATPLCDLVIEVEELPFLADPQILPAYVKSIERPADGVALLRLRLPLHANMLFTPGQHVDILLSDGRRRPYSIASVPRPEGVIDLEFHIRHMAGGAYTEHVFRTMKARDRVQLEGPLGSFFLRQSEKPVIFLATGTGYAPIRSILLDALKWTSDRQMRLYWGARSLSDLYLIDEVRQLSLANPRLHFVPVLSRPSDDRWAGAMGHVQDVALADTEDVSGYQVYACGSPAMVTAAEEAFVRRGLPREEFFSDAYFTQGELVQA